MDPNVFILHFIYTINYEISTKILKKLCFVQADKLFCNFAYPSVKFNGLEKI